MRSRRLSKKLHKNWLELGVIDASLVSYWRDLLFDSDSGVKFELNAQNSTGLPKYVVDALGKYDLKYYVAKVSPSEAPDWLSKGGLIVFRFWAADFPEVCSFTGNNPEIR